mgnify:CR=1 FL=1
MGIYLVTKWIRMMSRKAGWLSTALYLKCCAVALMRVREVSLIKTDLTPESDSPNQNKHDTSMSTLGGCFLDQLSDLN